MKRIIGITFLLLLVATSAYAFTFSWDGIKTLITDNAIAVVVTFLLGLGIVAKYTDWFSAILISTGALLISVGAAIADRKLTKEEWADFKAKFAAFRASLKKPTPHTVRDGFSEDGNG